MPAELHFAIDALALQLLFQGTERLVNVVIADDDLHDGEAFDYLGAWQTLALYGHLDHKPSCETRRQKWWKPDWLVSGGAHCARPFVNAVEQGTLVPAMGGNQPFANPGW
jgi:hypothetical protein